MVATIVMMVMVVMCQWHWQWWWWWWWGGAVIVMVMKRAAKANLVAWIVAARALSVLSHQYGTTTRVMPWSSHTNCFSQSLIVWFKGPTMPVSNLISHHQSTNHSKFNHLCWTAKNGILLGIQKQSFLMGCTNPMTPAFLMMETSSHHVYTLWWYIITIQQHYDWLCL